jgi:hypothetical protein
VEVDFSSGPVAKDHVKRPGNPSARLSVSALFTTGMSIIPSLSPTSVALALGGTPLASREFFGAGTLAVFRSGLRHGDLLYSLRLVPAGRLTEGLIFWVQVAFDAK